MIALGLGTDPASNGPWPVYAAGEPDKPDSAITVYDTVGRQEGRTHVDGEAQEHHGVQVRVRSAAHTAGYAKARAVAVALDEDVLMNSVHIGAASYRVWAVARTGDVLSLGKESPDSKRSLFTINALVSLRQTN